MADTRQNEKVIKKDQRGTRDSQEEAAEEVRDGRTEPLVQHPNRDRARGDWDRSGVHHDEQA